MEKYRYQRDLTSSLVILILFITGQFLIGLPLFYNEAVAEQREYKVERFNENLTIQPTNIRYITYALDEGEEFEVVWI